MKVRKTMAVLLFLNAALAAIQIIFFQVTWWNVLSVVGLAITAAGLLIPPPVDLEAQIAELRREGVYPAPGSGSDADVVNLLRADHKLLAIRLYKEIHQVPLKRAVEAVKQLN